MGELTPSQVENTEENVAGVDFGEVVCKMTPKPDPRSLPASKSTSGAVKAAETSDPTRKTRGESSGGMKTGGNDRTSDGRARENAEMAGENIQSSFPHSESRDQGKEAKRTPERERRRRPRDKGVEVDEARLSKIKLSKLYKADLKSFSEREPRNIHRGDDNGTTWMR